MASTTVRSRSHDASFDGFGRRAPTHRSLVRPTRPIAARVHHSRATSREIVDGDRPNRRAIDRNDSPPARPREISSRSVNDNRNGDRTGSRAGGRRITRRCFATPCDAPRPISLPINRLGNPCAANSAIRHFSNSDNRSAMTHLPIDPTRSKEVMR